MESSMLQDPRVYLAAERTLLAWIRTGLALMGFSFVVAQFGLFLREVAAVADANPPALSAGDVWLDRHGTGSVWRGGHPAGRCSTFVFSVAWRGANPIDPADGRSRSLFLSSSQRRGSA